MELLNQKLIASNLNSIQEQASSSTILKYLYQVSLIVGVLSFALSEEMIIWVDQSVVRDTKLASHRTALPTNSSTRYIARVVAIVTSFDTTMDPILLQLSGFTIVCILVLITWTILMRKIPSQLLGFISALIVCYPSIVLVLNQVFYRMIFCKHFDIIDSYTVENSTYLETTITKRLLQTPIKRVWSIQGSSRIECVSIQHGISSVIAVAGLAANITLRLIASTLVSSVPDHRFVYGKLGVVESLKAGLFFLLPLAKGAVIHLAEDILDAQKFVYYLILFSFSMLLLLQIQFRGFYTRWTVIQANIQLSIGIFGIGAFLLPIQTGMKINEFSYIFIALIAYVVIHRLSHNSRKNRRIKMLAIWFVKPKQFTSIADIEELYYYFIDLIHTTLEDIRKGDSRRRICFLYFGKYLQLHKVGCIDPICGCQTKDIPFEFDPLGAIANELHQVEWISLCTFVLSDFLKHLILVSSSERLLCIKAYFEASYKGQIAHAYKILNQNTKRYHSLELMHEGAKHSILTDRILDIFNRLVNVNILKGELGMTKLVRDSNLITKEKNMVDCFLYLEFLAKFQIMKKEVAECLDLRNKFLSEVLLSGNLRKAHANNIKFIGLCFSIINIYQLIKEKTSSLYSPLLLVYGEFQFFIFQNIATGRKIINEFKLKAEYHRMTLLSIKFPHELCLTFANITSKGQGEITYVTANIVRRTGFTNKEIEKGGIESLIPEPIRSVHSRFVLSTQQGSLLQNPNLSKGYCNTKNGIVPIQFSVRYSFSLIRGVEYVSCLCFAETINNDKVLLLDRNGVICTTNYEANQYFDSQIEIGFYCPELQEQLKVVQSFLDTKSLKRSNTIKFENLIQNNEVDASVQYYKSARYSWMKFIDKKMNVRNMRFRLEKNYYPSIQFNYWVLRIKDVEEIGAPLIKDTLLEYSENHLKTETWKAAGMLNHLMLNKISQSVSVQRRDSLEDIPEEIEEDEFEGISKNLEDYQGINFFRNKNFEKQSPTFAKLLTIKKENIVEKKHSDIIEKDENDNREYFSEEDSYFSKSKNLAKINPLLEFKQPKASGLTIFNTHKKNTSKSPNPTIKERINGLNIESSVRSSYTEERSKISKISMIVHTYIKPASIHFPTMVIQTILSLVLLIFTILVLVKVPVQQDTNTEVRDKAITLDYFSKQLWGFTQTLLILERFRFMKEGIMGDIMELRPDKPKRYNLIGQYYNQSCNVLLKFDMLADSKISSVTDRTLLDFDAWVNSQAIVENYRIDPDTQKPLWFKETMSRRNAVEFLSARMRRFYKRDYENGTIPLLGINRDRDNDPEEDLIRRNYIGDIYNQILARKSDFNEYLKNLSKRNENYIVITFALSLGTSVIVMILLWFYITQELASMQFFYKTLFRIKVDFMGKY